MFAELAATAGSTNGDTIRMGDGRVAEIAFQACAFIRLRSL